MEGVGRQAAIAFAPMWEALGRLGGQFGEWIVGAVRDAIPYIQTGIAVGVEFGAMIGRWIVMTAEWLGVFEPATTSFRNGFIEIAAVGIVYFRRFGDSWNFAIMAMQYRFLEFRKSIAQGLARIIHRYQNKSLRAASKW